MWETEIPVVISQEMAVAIPRYCQCVLGCVQRAVEGYSYCEYCAGVCDCGCWGCLREDEDSISITFLCIQTSPNHVNFK